VGPEQRQYRIAAKHPAPTSTAAVIRKKFRSQIFFTPANSRPRYAPITRPRAALIFPPPGLAAASAGVVSAMHPRALKRCPLSGVKRTSAGHSEVQRRDLLQCTKGFFNGSRQSHYPPLAWRNLLIIDLIRRGPRDAWIFHRAKFCRRVRFAVAGQHIAGSTASITT